LKLRDILLEVFGFIRVKAKSKRFNCTSTY